MAAAAGSGGRGAACEQPVMGKPYVDIPFAATIASTVSGGVPRTLPRTPCIPRIAHRQRAGAARYRPHARHRAWWSQKRIPIPTIAEAASAPKTGAETGFPPPLPRTGSAGVASGATVARRWRRHSARQAAVARRTARRLLHGALRASSTSTSTSSIAAPAACGRAAGRPECVKQLDPQGAQSR